MSSTPPDGNCPNCGAAFPVLGPAPGEPVKCPICGWIYSGEGADEITLAREMPEELKAPDLAEPEAPPAGAPPAPETTTPPGEPAPQPAPPAPQPQPPVGPEARIPEVMPGTPDPMAHLTSGYSIASLVLGICSICTCFCYGVPSLICGILAVVFSRRGERDAAAGLRGEQSFGLSKAGRITGWIGIGLSVLYFLVIIGYIIFIFFLIGQNSWH